MRPFLYTIGGVILAEILVAAGRLLFRKAKQVPVASPRTTPPGRYVVLFDGHCKFCIAQSKNLQAIGKPGALEMRSFQEPGALSDFPGVSYDACMRAMHLVTPKGRVYEGFAAIAHAVATRPVVGWLAYAYYLPGVHMICDGIYALIAAYRYRLMGKAVAAGECENGTCSLHFGKTGKASTGQRS